MEFTFLGTSAGAPSRDRNMTGLCLRADEFKGLHLFDCGEGTQLQIIKTPLTLFKLKKIFITHLHGDHIFGLPGVLTSRSLLQGSPSDLTIIGPVGIKGWIEETLRISGSHLNYSIDFIEIPDEGLEFVFPEGKYKAIRLSHGIESFAYCFEENPLRGKILADKLEKEGLPKGALWGKLQKGKTVSWEGKKFDPKDFLSPPLRPRKVIIGGDNDSPEILLDQLRDTSLFIHEATLIESDFKRVSFDIRHSTAKKVAKTAQEAKVPNLILTHFSPRYGLNSYSQEKGCIKQVYDEANSFYKGNLFLAKDLDRYILKPNGELEYHSS